MEKVRMYKLIDGEVVEGGPVNRNNYEIIWKEKGWRLSPPSKKQDKKETE